MVLGVKRLRVKKRGETTRGKTTRGGGGDLGAKCLVTIHISATFPRT